MAGFRDSWKKELDELVNTTGISFADVCAYIGSTYSKSVGFYYKTPKKRESCTGKLNLDTKMWDVVLQ